MADDDKRERRPLRCLVGWHRYGAAFSRYTLPRRVIEGKYGEYAAIDTTFSYLICGGCGHRPDKSLKDVDDLYSLPYTVVAQPNAKPVHDPLPEHEDSATRGDQLSRRR